MKLTFILCLTLLTVVKLSYQVDPDVNEVFDEDDMPEINILTTQITSKAIILNRLSDNFDNKLKSIITTVQRNCGEFLDKFAESMNNLFIRDDQYYAELNRASSTSVLQYNGRLIRTFNDVARYFGTKIRDVQFRVDVKLQNFIEQIHEKIVKFKAAIKRSINDLRDKVDRLKERYPGIESKDCSKMIKKFREGIANILESMINCVKDSTLRGLEAANYVDDTVLDVLKTDVQRMKTSWDCVVTTDGNYFYKFIKCTNFGSIKAVWSVLNGMTNTLDDNFDNALYKASKSIELMHCMETRLTNIYKDELVHLVQTVTLCSAELKRTPVQ